MEILTVLHKHIPVGDNEIHGVGYAIHQYFDISIRDIAPLDKLNLPPIFRQIKMSNIYHFWLTEKLGKTMLYY